MKKLPTTNYQPPHVADEVFPQAVKTKPRTKGVIFGYSDGECDDDDEQSTDEEVEGENENEDEDDEAIRLMMSTRPRVKIWK